MEMLKPIKEGKVREIYDNGSSLIMVATDRISCFDVILKNPVTGKGAVLSFHFTHSSILHGKSSAEKSFGLLFQNFRILDKTEPPAAGFFAYRPAAVWFSMGMPPPRSSAVSRSRGSLALARSFSRSFATASISLMRFSWLTRVALGS